MGFELLPIEDGDEDKYDVITITSPSRWTSYKFVGEVSPEPVFYDPTDADLGETEGYPAFVNHTTHDDPNPEVEDKIGIVDPYGLIIETHVYATYHWKKAIHQEIYPESLRPYLG